VPWAAIKATTDAADGDSATAFFENLEAAARSDDSSTFFALARATLLQTFAARWGISPDRVTSTELKARLGTAGDDVERLFALADEVQYAQQASDGRDFQRWLGLVRDQLAGEGP